MINMPHGTMSHTRYNRNGFTLIELLVSVFVFLLIMLAVVTIFIREVEAFRNAKDSQRSLENAQFAMNFVAKTLRTSIVTIPEDQTVAGVQEVYA
jgi:prepilin-type N-terminal cleavage/methylation domain-containing protein